ncbi:MAG TPA: hypothetical protein RMH99_00595 [Sandaracinaceae bacterium LLY-WYZ-13_1]|nr:hypothetical protein [Sandaracinaceae bacterium LLY-WYZ-13_1]
MPALWNADGPRGVILCEVSWEPADRWPGESGGGGAFRSGSEPVLAERSGPRWLERLSLFWHSTPEMPMGAVARRAALTTSFVYVDRFDGRRERVARSRLRGIRRDGRRLVIGVLEGEDLVLPHRPRCELARALATQLGGHAPSWVARRRLSTGALLALVGAALTVSLFTAFPLGRVWPHLAAGRWLADDALGFYGGWLALLLAVAGLAWVPERFRADRLGLEVRRGLFGWLPFFVPAERVRGVAMRRRYGQPHARQLLGFSVEVVLHHPARVGSLLRHERVVVERMGADVTAQAATEVARLVADRLDVPVLP